MRTWLTRASSKSWTRGATSTACTDREARAGSTVTERKDIGSSGLIVKEYSPERHRIQRRFVQHDILVRFSPRAQRLATRKPEQKWGAHFPHCLVTAGLNRDRLKSFNQQFIQINAVKHFLWHAGSRWIRRRRRWLGGVYYEG